MVRCTLGLVAALLTLPAAAQEPAKAVVEKAVKATGGEETLKKFPAGASQMKGKMILGGTDVPFTGSMVFSVPGKVRMELNAEIGGRKVSLVQLVDGAKVKQVEDGKPTENISEAARTELQQAALLQEISLLYPLLDPAKYTLKDGKGTVLTNAVVVEAKGLKTVTLYFDKNTGLLAKMTRDGLSPAGAKVAEETVYDDYKDAGGVKIPMKTQVMHDGKLFLDFTVTEYKPLAKTDEKFDTGS